MPPYRLYFFGSRRIDGTDVLEANRDDEAVILVRAGRLPIHCERFGIATALPLGFHSHQMAPAAA